MGFENCFDLAKLRSEADRLGIEYDLGHGGINAVRDLQQRLTVRQGQSDEHHRRQNEAAARAAEAKNATWSRLINRRVRFIGTDPLFRLVRNDFESDNELKARLAAVQPTDALEIQALLDLLAEYDEWLECRHIERLERVIVALADRDRKKQEELAALTDRVRQLEEQESNHA